MKELFDEYNIGIFNILQLKYKYLIMFKVIKKIDFLKLIDGNNMKYNVCNFYIVVNLCCYDLSIVE